MNLDNIQIYLANNVTGQEILIFQTKYTPF